MTFMQELEEIINRHSVENASNTPDWLLAEYLNGCLEVYEETIQKRDKWYGDKHFDPEATIDLEDKKDE